MSRQNDVKIIYSLLSMLIIFAGRFAVAAPNSCTPVDYSSRIGPATSQGDVNDCWAYADANMLTYKYGRAQNPISPESLLLENMIINKSTAKNNMAESIDGNGIVLNFDQLAGKTLCTQAKMDSDNSQAQILTNLAARAKRAKIEINCNLAATATQAYMLKAKAAEAQFRTLQPTDPNIETRLHSLRETISSSEFEAIKNQMAMDMQSDCKNSSVTIPTTLKSNHRYYQTSETSPGESRSSVSKDVDSALARDSGPIALGVEGSVLAGPSHKGLHVVTLIGRSPSATDPNMCLYRLRNSWGPDCSNYPPNKYSCDPKTGDIFVTKGQLDMMTVQLWDMK